jgi:methylenetetrahydrofolate reductase (NADPH)
VIASGVLDTSGLQSLGVAGHPEGHRAVITEKLWQALRIKQEFAARSGIAMHVVTQFGFDPPAINDWAAQFHARGLMLPVHAGIAGPTSLTKLLRFAMKCGVGASLRTAARNMRAVAHVASHTVTAEEILPALVTLGAGGVGARIVQPHLFAFGGALETARWISSVARGEFAMPRDGNRIAVMM